MESHNGIDINSPSIQDRMLELHKDRCHHGVRSLSGWCPEIWDAIFCWPSTPPGELSVHPCPHYIAGFDFQANASRQCMPDGQWYKNPDTNSTWSNYTQCFRTELVTVLMDISGVQPDNVALIKKYLPIVKIISKVGYTISLSTLVVAFFILAAIKKLRCQRNMLHMHLFASFMMRAFMALLKDILFVSGVGLASDILTKNGERYWLGNEVGNESNWQCKAVTSLWQYFILANYFWILMEGLYLHNLVFLALFADANSSIAGYIVAGWGLPAIFVSSWIASRAIYDDTYCWTTNLNPNLFLVIRVPTMLSILINFVLFINIVRVLLSKLKTTVSEETQRYKRWARSTLVLVPLFGVHYTIFLGMSYSIGVNETVELVWLFCDQLFASFQGFFVAVLYCFLNGEVRTEVSRCLRSGRWSCALLRIGPRRSTHSSSTCSCNTAAKSIGGHSKRKIWWRPPTAWRCSFHKRSQPRRRSTHSMASTQDVATRGGSLASSRGYLEIAGSGTSAVENKLPHHSSPLCSKYTDQSLLSFCSNVSDVSGGAKMGIEKIRDQHRWSDSECCHLAYELHNLQHDGHS